MGRQKSVAELQRNLDFAKRRAAYKPPAPDVNGTINKRPRIAVEYQTMTTGATDEKYTIQASASGIKFFGGLPALGLLDAGTTGPMPQSYDPAQVHATVADGTPKRETAKPSGRKYIRYARGTRSGGVQNSFTAPVSAESNAALLTRVRGLLDANKDEVGGPYGRLWFSPEIILIVQSGNA